MLRAALAPLVLAVAALPGGSNFDWYRVDRPAPGTCVREPYGVVASFGDPAARAEVDRELAQMFAAGQRRLRIGIFHGHGIRTGTVMDSAGGDLSSADRRNLADLLATVRRTGFTGVEIAFHPQPAVETWTTWDERAFREHWSLIRRLRPIVRAAGLPYRIDLANEGIPTAGQPLLLRYSRRLWTAYARAFGRDDTVGFSAIGDPAHVVQERRVYGTRPPYTLELHFYGGTAGLDEGAQARAADATLRRAGLTQPWVVGEAFYDDAQAAQQLRDAITATGRRVYDLTQWPLTRASACADTDVGAPVAFDAYAQAGFDPLPDPARPPVPVLRTRTLHVSRGGTVVVSVGCRATVTRCYGTVAGRRFSAYASAYARVTLRAPRGGSAATIRLSARSEESTRRVRRVLRVVLVRT